MSGAKDFLSTARLGRIKAYVNALSDVVDLQFREDESLPRLPIDVRSVDKAEDSRVAHYLLLVASIDQGRLVGAAENARSIVCHLFKSFGDEVFGIEDVLTIRSIFPILPNPLIASILVSVNKFVERVAEGDLYSWGLQITSQGLRPLDVAEQLASGIEWMGKDWNTTARKKVWMYMRWMVRPHPDIGLWQGLGKSELYLPLDSNAGRFFERIGVLPKETRLYSKKQVVETTMFVRDKLFPDDPAKIDYPAFLFGIDAALSKEAQRTQVTLHRFQVMDMKWWPGRKQLYRPLDFLTG